MHDHPPGCSCQHQSALPDPHAAREGAEVSLTLRLVCRDMAEMLIVLDHAPAHITESRIEPGCLQFDLRQTADPLVFAVAERFADANAYRAHQARTRASVWGEATAHITREDYDRRGVTE